MKYFFSLFIVFIPLLSKAQIENNNKTSHIGESCESDYKYKPDTSNHHTFIEDIWYPEFPARPFGKYESIYYMNENKRVYSISVSGKRMYLYFTAKQTESFFMKADTIMIGDMRYIKDTLYKPYKSIITWGW